MATELLLMCVALAVRVIAAAMAKADSSLSYNDESRAVVLTPKHADGSPCWRTKADGNGPRDLVVRVYVAFVNGTFTVAIAGHAWPVSGRKAWMLREKLTQEQAEKLVAATVVCLMRGDFTKTLAAHVPNTPALRTTYVLRPDTVSKGRKAAPSAEGVGDDDLDAILAPADKPADKPVIAAPKPTGK